MVPISIPGFADPVCSITHLLAAAVFAVLSFGLVKEGRGDTSRALALGLFAFSCVLLLAVSGVYHMLPRGSGARMVMRRLDHAAIFTLIAATFTAPHAILFRGVWRWGPISMIWGLGITALVLKTVFFEAMPELLGVLLYVGMGWIGVISGAKLWRRHRGLVLRLLAGGLAYTLGAVIEFFRWPLVVDGVIGPHELFHVAAIVGVAIHWRFVQGFAHGRHRPLQRQAKGAAVYALGEHNVDELLRLYGAEAETAGRSRDEVVAMLRHSLPVGLLNDEGDLVACARVLTDRVSLALVVDVAIDPTLGEAVVDLLMDAVLAHPELQRVRRIGLVCPQRLRQRVEERQGFTFSADDGLLWREARSA